MIVRPAKHRAPASSSQNRVGVGYGSTAHGTEETA